MPIYTEAPGTGDNTTKTTHYLKIKDQEILDQSGNKYAAIEGNLRWIAIWHDEGNKAHKIMPSDNLVFDLEDDEHIYRVKTKININFSLSLGNYIDSLSIGDKLLLKIKPGNDIQVSFASLFKDTDGNWTPVSYTQLQGTKEERAEQIKNLVETKFVR